MDSLLANSILSNVFCFLVQREKTLIEVSAAFHVVFKQNSLHAHGYSGLSASFISFSIFT